MSQSKRGTSVHLSNSGYLGRYGRVSVVPPGMVQQPLTPEGLLDALGDSPAQVPPVGLAGGKTVVAARGWRAAQTGVCDEG